MESVKIIDTNEENVGEFSMCGYKNPKIEGYKRKIQWLKNRFSEGMKYKILYSQNDGAVGGIEFIPGEYSWRPVTAKGYFVIHCIFIMSRKYKDNSYGSLLLNDCLEDARKENMLGVAVVTRKGTWMAGRELFIKNGFEIVDKAPPDFELLVRKFRSDSPTPKFKGQWEMKLDKFGEGLFVLTSDQCPYTHKAVKEISETAENVYNIKVNIIELGSCHDAQKSPSAFGSFCMVYNGEIIADHPISNKRFTNIMNKFQNE